MINCYGNSDSFANASQNFIIALRDKAYTVIIHCYFAV